MDRNHEVMREQMLLNEYGELREPGWSRRLVQKYDRSMIKAPKWRSKEWDYYLVLSDSFGAALALAQLSRFLMTGISDCSQSRFCVSENSHGNIRKRF